MTTRLQRMAFIAAMVPMASSLVALDGDVRIHDPSTLLVCDGKYYTCGTTLVSDDKDLSWLTS